MDVINDIFNLTDKQPAPVAGAVLVAKPTVDDLCFKRGVILLVNHNAHDSMGLMVNYEAGYLLHEVIPGIDCEEEIPVYIGGPVDTERLFYIHTLGPDIIPRSREIAGGIYIGGDYDAVKAYVNSGATVDGKIKFLVGYSGWSAGQLDAEIRRHDWAVDLRAATSLCATQATRHGAKPWLTSATVTACGSTGLTALFSTDANYLWPSTI